MGEAFLLVGANHHAPALKKAMTSAAAAWMGSLACASFCPVQYLSQGALLSREIPAYTQSFQALLARSQRLIATWPRLFAKDLD